MIELKGDTKYSGGDAKLHVENLLLLRVLFFILRLLFSVDVVLKRFSGNLQGVNLLRHLICSLTGSAAGV